MLSLIHIYKPQTTRNKILAIRTTADSQMIFIDTPGIHTPRNKLGEFMVNTAKDSVFEADVVVFVTAADKAVTNTEKKIIEKIRESGLPAVLVINKTDQVKKDVIPEQIVAYNELFEFTATVPLSAKNGDGVEACVGEIEGLLEKGPEFYPVSYTHLKIEKTCFQCRVPEKPGAYRLPLSLGPARRLHWNR